MTGSNRPPQAGTHDPADHGPSGYLSTACLHGEHEHCRNVIGREGPKVPGRCKWCPARCVCPAPGCHPPAEGGAV